MFRLKRRTAADPAKNFVGKPFKGIISRRELFGRSEDDIRNLLDMGWEAEIAGAAPTNQNTVLANPVYLPRAVVVSTDVTVLQGDMVWWDAVNYTLKPLLAAAQVAVGAAGGFVGVAQGTDVPNVYPNPPGGPSENIPGVMVQRGGTVKVNSTLGDGGYWPFEPVTVGVDQQTVTRGAQTTANRVGFVIVPPPVNARSGPATTPLPETTVAGAQVELWIEPKFPDTALL